MEDPIDTLLIIYIALMVIIALIGVQQLRKRKE